MEKNNLENVICYKLYVQKTSSNTSTNEKKIKANFIWTLIYPFEGILCKNKDDFPKLR